MYNDTLLRLDFEMILNNKIKSPAFKITKSRASTLRDSRDSCVNQQKISLYSRFCYLPY